MSPVQEVGGRGEVQARSEEGGVRLILHRIKPSDPLIVLGIPRPGAQAAAVSEGFCPDCLVPLAGDPRTRCPGCRIYWRLTTGTTGSA